jgi:threonine aldolase
MIDYRSDTMTRPTPEMKEAMFAARVGDDVFGEDPTINELEKMAAEMFGMEASLFCPSGTMTNQIAIKCHTQPGDEVICDASSHIYQYEGGGIAFNSSASVKLIPGDHGRISAQQVLESINADDVHKARTSLVSLENTSNRGGGSCYELDEIKQIRKVCDDHQLILHLDGARLFNALVARRQTPAEHGKLFHSISICLSKSLGCPVGSLLLGNAGFIKKSRRIRKVFGGGMRQAGYLAAAGIFALENHVERLATDHEHATMIAEALRSNKYVAGILPVQTNIIIFSLTPEMSSKAFVDRLKEKNILGHSISPTQVRLVTHLDITHQMVEETIQTIQNF